MKRMAVLIVLLAFVGVSVIPPAQAGVHLNEGVHLEPSNSNANYTVNQSFTVDNLTVESDGIVMNGEKMSVNPLSGYAEVKLLNYSKQIKKFTVTSDDTTNFVFSNNIPNEAYNIFVDGQYEMTKNSDSSGYFSFSHSSWSTHTFTITTSFGDFSMNIAEIGNDYTDFNIHYNTSTNLSIYLKYRQTSEDIWQETSNITISGNGTTAITIENLNESTQYEAKLVVTDGTDVNVLNETLTEWETKSVMGHFTDNVFIPIAIFLISVTILLAVIKIITKVLLNESDESNYE